MMMLLLTVVSLKAEGMMSSWGLQKCEPGEMQTDSSLSDERKFFLASFISLARRVTSVFTVIPRTPPKKKKLESQTTNFALANHEMCSLLSDITPRLPPQKYEHLFPLSPCSSDFSGWVCCYATLSVNWLIVFFHKPKHYLGSHHLETLVEFP